MSVKLCLIASYLDLPSAFNVELIQSPAEGDWYRRINLYKSVCLKEYKKAVKSVESIDPQKNLFICRTSSDYPERLLHLSKPPWVIFFRGPIEWLSLSRTSLAVVGARLSQRKNLRWMETYLPEYLKLQQTLVVSGGARGIDQCSTRICRFYENPHVIVLPGPLDNIYPKSLDKLVCSQQVLLISEVFPGKPIYPYSFVVRNRIIAALSHCVLVVEARIKSGTLTTVKSALSLGREVCVVPQHPLDENSSGCNQLIADGARPVVGAKDLVECMSQLSLY